MKKKVISGLVLTLFLIGMLTLAFNIQPVKSDYTWTETIYIRADGSIEPDTAPISTVDNVTYTLTDNIVGDVPEWTSAIVVERDNIVVNGAGYTLQGTVGEYITIGINLTRRSNITIKNMEIKTFMSGIWLISSSFNTISKNNITDNGYGIGFSESSNNSIYGNNIVDNDAGIVLYGSTHNHIYGNNIINNEFGVLIWECSDNVFYHSNFINNTQHVNIPYSGYANFWDNGVEGNYWSNYTGVDSNYDGICDSWYNITQDNTDHYPLMDMFSDFPVTHQEETYHVTTICSSIISEFQFNDTAKTISFNVTGPDYTIGFCRVTVPNIIIQDLWEGNYEVLVDGEEPIMMNNWTDGTYTYIYFKYVLSEHKVEIVPEFPTWTSILIIIIVLTVATVTYKRRLLKTPIY